MQFGIEELEMADIIRIPVHWRGGGAAERAGFENRLARKGHGGSNPPLSVKSPKRHLLFRAFCF